MSTDTKAQGQTQFNVRLPADLKTRLETYARLVGRSQAMVASEALADYLDWRTPQIEALKQTVAAADRGEFASADEVAAFFKAYET